MRLVGHAGLGRHRPAGAPTAADIAGAAALGVRALELDVALAADALVVLHDTVLAGRPVAATTLPELRRLLPGLLTLDEALDAGAQADLLLLDLKGPGVAEPLARSLRTRRDPRLAACTDDLGDLLTVRHVAPRLPRWRTLPMVGEGRGRRRRTARAVALRHLLPEALPLLAREVAAAGVCVDRLVLTPRLVEAARALGLVVDTWTVNDPRHLLRVARCRPDLVTTDEPARLASRIDGSVASTTASPRPDDRV